MTTNQILFGLGLVLVRTVGAELEAGLRAARASS